MKSSIFLVAGAILVASFLQAPLARARPLPDCNPSRTVASPGVADDSHYVPVESSVFVVRNVPEHGQPNGQAATNGQVAQKPGPQGQVTHQPSPQGQAVQKPAPQGQAAQKPAPQGQVAQPPPANPKAATSQQAQSKGAAPQQTQPKGPPPEPNAQSPADLQAQPANGPPGVNKAFYSPLSGHFKGGHHSK
ncbi:hypothetical protein BDW22DRAFT_1425563 [Trametopsis cervina]|nr:hypothetical protein BDW22DRAFT_1425563 [Trametopsis cervina]